MHKINIKLAYVHKFTNLETYSDTQTHRDDKHDKHILICFFNANSLNFITKKPQIQFMLGKGIFIAVLFDTKAKLL